MKIPSGRRSKGFRQTKTNKCKIIFQEVTSSLALRERGTPHEYGEKDKLVWAGVLEQSLREPGTQGVFTSSQKLSLGCPAV